MIKENRYVYTGKYSQQADWMLAMYDKGVGYSEIGRLLEKNGVTNGYRMTLSGVSVKAVIKLKLKERADAASDAKVVGPLLIG